MFITRRQNASPAGHCDSVDAKSSQHEITNLTKSMIAIDCYILLALQTHQ